MSEAITANILKNVNRQVFSKELGHQAKQETINLIKAQSHSTGKALMINKDNNRRQGDSENRGKELSHRYIPYSVFLKKRPHNLEEPRRLESALSSRSSGSVAQSPMRRRSSKKTPVPQSPFLGKALLKHTSQKAKEAPII